MILKIDGHLFVYEVECTVRLFYPGELIAIEGSDGARNAPPSPDRIETAIIEGENRLTLTVRVAIGEFDRTLTRRIPAATSAAERERKLCLLLFLLLCKQSGKRPPWGLLTGVRPVRHCHKWQREGKTGEDIIDEFGRKFLVLPSKAKLALETAEQEREILRASRPNGFSLYISIPFCPSRCLYCSFVSHDIKGMAKLLPDYLELLEAELAQIGQTARECGLLLQTVYVGGGTPTTLEPEQLTRLLRSVAENFDMSGVGEYTVEAGRPDTVTADKLAVLREFGVGRISVNPQTMNAGVLREIGRKHSPQDFLKAYKMAREAGFDTINADIIAGLPGEDSDSFLSGLDELIGLGPENITAHTLTVKRSSRLREASGAFSETDFDISVMLDKAKIRLTEAGYRPYYLYRQKGTRQNLENTGYSKPGHESVYNVFIMEEVHTILAAGAGAVTKLCAPENRIQRIFNFKYPYEYISRHGEILARKSAHVIRSFYNEGNN